MPHSTSVLDGQLEPNKIAKDIDNQPQEMETKETKKTSFVQREKERRDTRGSKQLIE